MQIKGTSITYATIIGLLFVAIVAHFVFPGLRHVAIVALCSAIFTTALVKPVAALARHYGAIDHPSARKIHTTPTPRWGGIAIFIAIIASSLTGYTNLPQVYVVLAGASLIFIVGVLDDLFGLNAKIRLLAQIGASTILIIYGVRITFLPDNMLGDVGEIALTYLWLIGITNAINFLDGIDGLVCCLAAGSSFIFTILALLLNQAELACLATAVCAACLAFLGFNLLPARIFLGDCGSTTIGFLLAAMGLVGTWSTTSHDYFPSFLVPVSTMGVAIYDMIFTTVARIHSGKVHNFTEWLNYTGLDHIHHRFNRLGWSRTQTVLVIWFLNISISLNAILLVNDSAFDGLVHIAQTTCVFIIIAMLEVVAMKRGPNGCNK